MNDMMPSGKYYVGDLCYVMHKEWSEVCGVTIKGEKCLEGVFQLNDGRKFAMFGTQWGDGTYEDQEGNSYPVDSGTIGCILVSDITHTDDENDTNLGTVHTFTDPFRVRSVNGILFFGDVTIDTDPQYHDYPEYDEWNEPDLED